MCGRYYRRSDKQKLAEHFRVVLLIIWVLAHIW
jgi:hypothetical protein